MAPRARGLLYGRHAHCRMSWRPTGPSVLEQDLCRLFFRRSCVPGAALPYGTTQYLGPHRRPGRAGGPWSDSDPCTCQHLVSGINSAAGHAGCPGAPEGEKCHARHLLLRQQALPRKHQRAPSFTAPVRMLTNRCTSDRKILPSPTRPVCAASWMISTKACASSS